MSRMEMGVQKKKDKDCEGVCANSRDNYYDDNYGLFPCSTYWALELRYSDNNRLNKQDEIKLVERVLSYGLLSNSVIRSIDAWLLWFTKSESPGRDDHIVY